MKRNSVKPNHFWVVEQRYKRTWYPFIGEPSKRDAQQHLRDFIFANHKGKEYFRLRKYVAQE